MVQEDSRHLLFQIFPVSAFCKFFPKGEIFFVKKAWIEIFLAKSSFSIGNP
jgi:hypothetical protein